MYVSHGFRFVRVRGQCGSKHLIQIREQCRSYAVYTLEGGEPVTEIDQLFCDRTHCISVTNAHLPGFAFET